VNPGEHEVMARVEETHWWYRGLRDVVTRSLREPRFRLPPNPHVLDAGCGTGQNLKALGELLQPAYLGGFDISEEGLGFARRKIPSADLYQSDLANPTLHVEELNLAVSLDVICLPGVERVREGLERLVAALRPGGLFVLNLPAYDWLYSEHDAAVHTTERYTARRVRALLNSLGLRVELLSYRLFLLFPLVVLKRLPSLMRARPDEREARSDLHAVPTEFTNRSLLAVMKVENQLIARGGRLPWGSSVFAIGRKV
jgi:SAM-dependent methyltransferase